MVHDPLAGKIHLSFEVVLCLIQPFLPPLFSVESCKESEKSSDKGDTDSPLAKTEDKENKPGIHAMDP